MKHFFTLKRNHREVIPAYLKTLTTADIGLILNLQEHILSHLEDPQIFISSTEEEFLEELHLYPSHTLGIFTFSHQLIALGVLKSVGQAPSNYGRDLGLSGSLLDTIGHIDTTIVHSDFRGNHLQHYLIKELEQVAQREGLSTLCATVSPYNPYSLHTFIKMGYEIKADKLKYGGFRRYILRKDFT